MLPQRCGSQAKANPWPIAGPTAPAPEDCPVIDAGEFVLNRRLAAPATAAGAIPTQASDKLGLGLGLRVAESLLTPNPRRRRDTAGPRHGTGGHG